MKAKLTRDESTARARAARAVPSNVTADRYQVQLANSLATDFKKLTSVDRGRLVAIGSRIDANGYLFLYRVIDALGGNIITTIVGKKLTIVTRAKSYEGDNQFELLMQIIEDLCNAKCKIESGNDNNFSQPIGKDGQDWIGSDDL